MIPKFNAKHLRQVNASKPRCHVWDLYRLGTIFQIVILFGLSFNSSIGFGKVCPNELSFFGANGAKTLTYGALIHTGLFPFVYPTAVVLKKLGPLAFWIGSTSCFGIYSMIGLSVDFYHGVREHDEKYLAFLACSLTFFAILNAFICKLQILDKEEKIESVEDILKKDTEADANSMV